jgi:hypothetical protein
MRLGEKENYENCLLGRKDAFHVACVLCESDDHPLKPGDYVCFTGDAYCKVVKVEDREKAHGIVDPFLADDHACCGDLFWVLVKPGLASGVNHNFQLNIDGIAQGEWSCKECS